MITKQYLPFRTPREGKMPNGILLCITDKTGAELKEHLLKSRKAIHYYLDESGDVTALIPLSSVATQNQEEHREKIRIEIESKQGKISPTQIAALKRLLIYIQKEVFRIYAERLPFQKESVILSPEQSLPLEELLEEAHCNPGERRVYRVQTGCYQSLRDAEDRVECLRNAGIASYITEVREG